MWERDSKGMQRVGAGGEKMLGRVTNATAATMTNNSSAAYNKISPADADAKSEQVFSDTGLCPSAGKIKLSVSKVICVELRARNIGFWRVRNLRTTPAG